MHWASKCDSCSLTSAADVRSADAVRTRALWKRRCRPPPFTGLAGQALTLSNELDFDLRFPASTEVQRGSFSSVRQRLL